jgi:hypothetical protein
MFPKYKDWNVTLTPKGVSKRRLSRNLRLLIWTLLFTGLYQAKKSGLSAKYLKNHIRNAIIAILATGVSGMQRLLSAL